MTCSHTSDVTCAFCRKARYAERDARFFERDTAFGDGFDAGIAYGKKKAFEAFKDMFPESPDLWLVCERKLGL